MTGAGPLGCAPAELARSGTSNGRCSAELQRAASLYDPQLLQMINALNKKIGRNVFIAANTNQMQEDFLSTPRRYGNYRDFSLSNYLLFVEKKGVLTIIYFCYRIYNVEGCLLRTRAVQWDRFVYSTIEFVSEPRAIRVLGCVSSD